MTSPRSLQDLIGEIAHSFPTARVDYSPLPSGVCFLDVTFPNGRSFELEYSPTRGTGVSENFPDTPPFIGQDEVFPTIDEAIVRFKAFLADAALNESAVSGTAFVMHDKPISK